VHADVLDACLHHLLVALVGHLLVVHAPGIRLMSLWVLSPIV
jgi:hypothetical protein